MDDYVKGETLGEGSFGVVFRAVHKQVLGQHWSFQYSRLLGLCHCGIQLLYMLGNTAF